MERSPWYDPALPVIGADSKALQWERERQALGSPELAQFKIPVSVIVHPKNHGVFEDEYDAILKETLPKFGLTPKRAVYKAHDLGRLVGDNVAKYRALCYELQRRLLAVPDVHYRVTMTLLNHRALRDDGMVHIGGVYGRPTRKLSTGEFVNHIQASHHVLAAWHYLRDAQIKGAAVLLDGTDAVYPCTAWDDLTKRHKPTLITRGDQVFPILSAADIILRALDFSREERRFKIYPDSLDELVRGPHRSSDVSVANMAHDHLKFIRPRSDQAIFETELRDYQHRPTIFVAGVDVEGARDHFEESPLYDRVMDRAVALRAAVRIYQGKRDKFLLGTGATNDYFVPVLDRHREVLEFLKGVGKRVEELLV